MAGKITAGTIQLGDSSTATQNFVVNTAVDGSMKIARGNAGATTQDVLTVSSGGAVGVPNGISGAVTTTGITFSDATTQTTSGTASQFGIGQTWQNVTRTSGTTYYNTTNKPIEVAITCYSGSNVSGYNATALYCNSVYIDDVKWYFATETGDQTVRGTIPVGASYRFTTTLPSVDAKELR